MNYIDLNTRKIKSNEDQYFKNNKITFLLNCYFNNIDLESNKSYLLIFKNNETNIIEIKKFTHKNRVNDEQFKIEFDLAAAGTWEYQVWIVGLTPEQTDFNLIIKTIPEKIIIK